MRASATGSGPAIAQASTMREVLASIPGFTVKPRRRSSKKISTAAQIEQTKDGKIDLETPDSILASTNLRALLNKQTFSMLPPLYQYNLIQLLPSVDREAIEMEQKSNPPSNETNEPLQTIRLSASSLNNEFFARACLEWRERLSEGEFTPENQVKLKTEAEREKNKLDPWKLKHFEPIWGEKYHNKSSKSSSSSNTLTEDATKSNLADVVESISKDAEASSSSSTITTSASTETASSSSSISQAMEEQMEFKFETKGGLTATIIKTTKIVPKVDPKTEVLDKDAIDFNKLSTSTSLPSVSSHKPDIKVNKQKEVSIKTETDNAIKQESKFTSSPSSSIPTTNTALICDVASENIKKTVSYLIFAIFLLTIFF